MRHSVTIALLTVIAALATAGCGSNSSTSTPTEPSPIAVTETFSGTLTVNGLQVLTYAVTRAGTTSAQLLELSDSTATLGLSLGTWNGTACSIVIANPSATLNTTVTGTAQSVGNFCVLINDVGKLTDAVDFTVAITHY